MMRGVEIFPGEPQAECVCRRCLTEINHPAVQMIGGRMILCQKCGNKRCPHANDHRHECTNSNAPGQKGSAYE